MDTELLEPRLVQNKHAQVQAITLLSSELSDILTPI